MTARVTYHVPGPTLHDAQEAAKALARDKGHRVRTVARVAPDGTGYRVELVVDEPPTTDVRASAPGQGGGGADDPPARTSWVAEARTDALAWRADHVAKGGV